MRRKQQTKVNNPLDDIEALLASICNHNNGTNCVTNSEVSKSPARRQTPESWAQQVSLSPEPSSKHTRLNKTARRTSTAAARKKKSKSHISSKRVVKSSNASAIRSSCWKAQKRPSTVTLLPNDSESSGESADGNKQAHTSSDDGENRVFLEKMKSLAQEKRMVEKRKMEAKRLKTIENMDELTAKSELRMKQVAGAVSKQIMRYTNSMKREMPDNCRKIISENQNCISSEQDNSKILADEVLQFKQHLRSLLSQFESERCEQSEKHKLAEKNLLAAVASASSKKQKLSSTLAKMDEQLRDD